MGDYKKS